MKKLFITILICIISFCNATAQTGIGTTTPDASAKLDVYANNKGFLPPRVTLTSYTDISTIPNPATGLLIYNTGSNVGLAAGYYFWNGNAWATIATAGGSGSFAASFLRGSRTASQSSIAVGGIVSFSAVDNTSGQDIALNTSNGKITLAPGNTYRLIAAVPNFTGSRPAFMWYNETSSSYIGSATNAYSPTDGASSAGAFSGIAEVVITPNVSTVLSFRLLSSLNSGSVTVGGLADFSTTGSYPWFEAQVISGNAPVTGQSVDYVQASLNANQTLSSAGNVIFNTSSGAGITLTSGGFELKANKTYKLEAALGGTSGGYAYYAWVDNTNTIIPGGSIGVTMKAGSAFTDAPQDKAVVFYTPTSNTTVYLRVLNVSGSVTVYAPPAGNNYSSTWATIQQVGSSAFVNPWILSGNDVYNNTGKVGIGTTTPASTLDVNGSANATTLNLTNSTIGTPSLVLRNGDAATSYSDMSQIKMGWSGSAAGKSQYAQFIHSRHNSGPSNNAIDFYLSDGTADNTVATGSTKAMSIESPGNLTVAGKINLADPSGNVAVKAAAFVNESVPVTLGDIQVQMAPNGLARSLQIKTTGTAFTGMVTAYTSYNGASGTNAFTYFSDVTQNINSTFAHLGTTWGFAASGDIANYFVRDTTNLRFWRITLMVGPSYLNNFISIERLL